MAGPRPGPRFQTAEPRGTGPSQPGGSAHTREAARIHFCAFQETWILAASWFSYLEMGIMMSVLLNGWVLFPMVAGATSQLVMGERRLFAIPQMVVL